MRFCGGTYVQYLGIVRGGQTIGHKDAIVHVMTMLCSKGGYVMLKGGESAPGASVSFLFCSQQYNNKTITITITTPEQIEVRHC